VAATRKVGPRGIAPVVLLAILPALSAFRAADPEPAPGHVTPPGAQLEQGMPLQLPPPPNLDTVQALDTALEELRRASWTLHDTQREHPDARGPTHAQDVDRWLLTPSTDARLQALRAQAQKQSTAGDRAGVAATLKNAAALVEQERYRAYLLVIWWWLQDAIAQHARNLEALEQRDPLVETPDERAARHTRIEQAAVGLGEVLPAAMTKDFFVGEFGALQQTVEANDQVLRAYNRERGKLAVAISKRAHDLGTGPAAQARETPCPVVAPAPLPTGTRGASLADGNLPPDALYPRASRRDSFEGVVLVRLWISPSGCVEKAAVDQSSGVADLDAAALTWVLQARFNPAVRDGEPVASQPRVPIAFKLNWFKPVGSEPRRPIDLNWYKPVLN